VRACSAAKGVGNATQALRLTAGTASVFGCNACECFRKCFARAGRRIAEEAPHPDEQSNSASLAWQISQRACVSAMNTPGGLTTIRTRHFRERRCDDQGQNLVLDEDIFHKQMSRERKQRS
jgi:hypothetical protein